MEAASYWYALFVRTGDEDKVKERVNYKFISSDLIATVPKRKLKERRQGFWQEIVRTVFPGYVFLQSCLRFEQLVSVKGIPGVFKLLHPAIQADEMCIIEKLTRLSEVIGFSHIMVKDEKIIVLDGPLKGLEYLILGANFRKGRVKIRLNLLGEPKLVDLGVAITSQGQPNDCQSMSMK